MDHKSTRTLKIENLVSRLSEGTYIKCILPFDPRPKLNIEPKNGVARCGSVLNYW